jgi:glycerol-3-phosphate cytidylyltransferase
MSDLPYTNLDTSEENTFSERTANWIREIKSRHAGKRLVFTASCFDLLHPGHILMLQDAKSQGDVLIVGLHTDPTINRSTKNRPVQTLEERRIMIHSVRYVDEIIEYSTEGDLYQIIVNLAPDLRVLGSDWQGKKYTGCHLDIPVYFHLRAHDWSTSGLRRRVWEAEWARRLDESETRK